jgi:hypothetical protein
MSVRSVVLALALASGLAAAADKHPKPLKVSKHAVQTPKAANHKNQNKKAVSRKSPKVAKRRTSNAKVAKHKTAKFQKHKKA